MRAPIALATLALTLSACGSHNTATPAKPAEPIPFDKIDLAAWTADLAALPEDISPHLVPLYDFTKKSDCKATVDDLSLRFTLSGAMPDVDRVSMEYVCPSEAHKVDDALKRNQETIANDDAACALPPSQRTEEQQQMVDAVGCS